MTLPHYTVLVEGRLVIDTPMTGMNGFFGSRVVRAPDAATAERQALKMVMNDWLANYVAHPRDLPSLSVVETNRTTWWRWLCWHNRGYSFFSEAR